MTEDNVVERDALYYPYVNFPSEDWLKSALLFSPHVYRIVADGYQPRRDTEFMRKLRTVETNGVPLLQHAELYSSTALRAQEVLLNRLRADIRREGEPFRLRFAKAATRATSENPYGFQLHPGKLTGNLIPELEGLGLAWVPDSPDDGPYRELHPAIGGAFLGSVAMACAADVGLAVVGDAEDATCRKLNQLAATCQFEALYDDFVHGKKQPRLPVGGTGERVAAIILFTHCDASALTIRGPGRSKKARRARITFAGELKGRTVWRWETSGGARNPTRRLRRFGMQPKE